MSIEEKIMYARTRLRLARYVHDTDAVETYAKHLHELAEEKKITDALKKSA